MRAATCFIILILLMCAVCIPNTNGVPRLHVETVPGATVPCDARAYMIDHDTGGTNVRSGPGKTFKIIGNLPTKDVEGIGVHLTGSNGEWVRIDRALEEGGDQERTFFPAAADKAKPSGAPLQGWIHTTLLGVTGMAVTKGGTNLYQGPAKGSRVVIRIPGGDDSVVVRGCRGGWMYIEYKKLKGWAAPDTLCANSLTTCN